MTTPPSSFGLPDPMRSPYAKLRRAAQIGKRLDGEIVEYLDRASRGILLVRDEAAKDLVFVATDLEPPVPEDWQEEFFDFFSNLRASLEYLAQALARAHVRAAPIPAKHQAAITFPTYAQRQSFRTLEGKIRPYFAPEVWTRLEQVQTYNATDDDIWQAEVGSGLAHPLPLTLSLIDLLAARGRHRFVQPVGFTVDMSKTPGKVGEHAVAGSGQIDGVNEPGREIGRWHFEELPPALPSSEQVAQFLGLDVRFVQVFYCYRDGEWCRRFGFDEEQVVSEKSECDFDFTEVPPARHFLRQSVFVVGRVLAGFAPAVRFGKAPKEWRDIAAGM